MTKTSQPTSPQNSQADNTAKNQLHINNEFAGSLGKLSFKGVMEVFNHTWLSSNAPLPVKLLAKSPEIIATWGINQGLEPSKSASELATATAIELGAKAASGLTIEAQAAIAAAGWAGETSLNRIEPRLKELKSEVKPGKVPPAELEAFYDAQAFATTFAMPKRVIQAIPEVIHHLSDSLGNRLQEFRNRDRIVYPSPTREKSVKTEEMTETKPVSHSADIITHLDMPAMGAPEAPNHLDRVLPHRRQHPSPIVSESQNIRTHELSEQSHAAAEILDALDPQKELMFGDFKQEYTRLGHGNFKKTFSLTDNEAELLEVLMPGISGTSKDPETLSALALKDSLNVFSHKMRMDLKTANGKILDLYIRNTKQVNELTKLRENNPDNFEIKMHSVGIHTLAVGEVCARATVLFGGDREQANNFRAISRGVFHCTQAAITEGWESAAHVGNALAAGVRVFGRGREAAFVARAIPTAMNIASDIQLMAVNPCLGGLKLALDVFGFFGDDDDDGLGEALQQLSSQMVAMHRDMIEGFNQVIDLQGKTMLMIYESDNRNQQRYEILRNMLYAVAQQNIYVSSQIRNLSEQEARHWLATAESLKVMHKNLSGMLVKLEEVTKTGLVALNKQATENTDSLTAVIERYNIVTQSGFLNVYQQNRLLQKKLAHAHSEIHDLRETTHRTAATQHENIYDQRERQLVSGDPEVNLRQCNDRAITGGNIDTEIPVAILEYIDREKHWQNPKVFDAINLLNHFARGNGALPLSHPDLIMTNIRAILANPASRTEQDLAYAYHELEKLQAFARDLASPDMLIQLFAKLGRAVGAFWFEAGYKLNQHQQNRVTDQLSAQLVQAKLNHARVTAQRSHYSKDEHESFDTAAANSEQDMLHSDWNPAGAAVTVHGATAARLVMPDPNSRSRIDLPAPLAKFPNLPKELAELETLRAGNLQFYYHHENGQLDVWAVFQATNGKHWSFRAYGCHIDVIYDAKMTVEEEEKAIMSAWNEFEGDASKIPANAMEEIVQLHGDVLAYEKEQLPQIFLECMQTELTHRIDALDATTAIIHLALRLAFDSFCDNDLHPLYHLLREMPTGERIKQMVMQHPEKFIEAIQSPENAAAICMDYARGLVQLLDSGNLFQQNLQIAEYMDELNRIMLFQPSHDTLDKRIQWAESLPQNRRIAVSQMLADDAFSNNQHEAAARYYALAQTIHPDDNKLRAKRAECLRELGRYHDAARVYGEVITGILEFTSRYDLLERDDNDRDAILFELASGLFETQLLLAQTLLDDKKPAEAFHILSYAKMLCSNHPQLLSLQAKAMEDLQYWKNAAEHYQKACAEENERIEFHLGNARCLRKSFEADTDSKDLTDAREAYGTVNILLADNTEHPEPEYIECLFYAEKLGWMAGASPDPSVLIEYLHNKNCNKSEDYADNVRFCRKRLDELHSDNAKIKAKIKAECSYAKHKERTLFGAQRQQFDNVYECKKIDDLLNRYKI